MKLLNNKILSLKTLIQRFNKIKNYFDKVIIKEIKNNS